MEISNLQVELTDISATKEPLCIRQYLPFINAAHWAHEFRQREGENVEYFEQFNIGDMYYIRLLRMQCAWTESAMIQTSHRILTVFAVVI